MEERDTKAETVEAKVHEILDEFLDPVYQYDFLQNPDVVRNKEDARRNGINCVSLAHLVTKELFGYTLPDKLGCAELYLDREHFNYADDVTAIRAGDLVWFGLLHCLEPPERFALQYDNQGRLVNWRDFPVKHVAIGTGLVTNGEPLLLHATYIDGRENKLWPLTKFSDYVRYRRLYGITHLRSL